MLVNAEGGEGAGDGGRGAKGESTEGALHTEGSAEKRPQSTIGVSCVQADARTSEGRSPVSEDRVADAERAAVEARAAAEAAAKVRADAEA